MSNWHVRNSVCDSQNFTLRLSEDSTTSTDNSSLQRFATNRKTDDGDDIIVISDSSCSSSPERTDISKRKSSSTSNVQNKEYRKLHFLEISSSESEKEKESDSSWTSDNRFSKKKSVNRTIIQVDKTPTETSSVSNDLSSDRLFDALLASNNASTDNKTGISSNVSCDRDQISKFKRFIDKSKEHINDRSCILITDQEINSKLREKYNIEERNKVINPNCAIYDNSNVLSKHPTFNTPKQDSTGKVRLTKKDTYKILQNIKCTQVVYDSPRERKENNVIIDESTDREEDIQMHPAISPNYNRKVQHPNDSTDVTDTSFKNTILQTDLSESLKPHIDISRGMDSFRPLSDRRKNQIRKWLLTNLSDSQSDSSFNTVPPSTRNSNSGNSSLERLEQTYETPNNRRKIKAWTDKKQETIVNSDNVIHSFLTRPKTLDQYFKKTKKSSEFCTPDNKPKLLPKAQTDKKASSVVNTFETKGIMDCADILDKLYGTSWRDKANAVLSTSKPRKTSVRSTNRIVQTER